MLHLASLFCSSLLLNEGHRYV
uniref:Uncharacterized protein n=1 Tax=Arundo donax TaxID=35708 RepID=A0A0A9HHN0_ARUDO